MPTERATSTALCTGTSLIVAGRTGEDKSKSKLQVVEVMNTETRQWSTVADLPQPLWEAPAAVCGDQLYVVGDSSMYTCSVLSLIQSRKSGAEVWKKVAAPPPTMLQTTCVSIRGRLLAIGGRDSDNVRTTAIRMYNPTTDSWKVISNMKTPRYWCIAAVLCNCRLMVVGGCTTDKTTEFATVEE